MIGRGTAVRNLLLLGLLAALPMTASAAEKRHDDAIRHQAASPQTANAPHPVKRNPCAVYGAGFMQIEGSSTCVKIGGSLRMEVGGSTGH